MHYIGSMYSIHKLYDLITDLWYRYAWQVYGVPVVMINMPDIFHV